MKITYPYMGNSHIAIKNLLERLGNEVVVPPRPSKKTLSYGTQHAPEFACLPFKILLGTYIEGLEMGADTIISTGGVGPCRAGLYTTLQERILRSLGYEFDFITLEPPSRYLNALYKNIKKIINRPMTLKEFWHVIRFVWEQLKLFDMAERKSFEIRPLEVNQGETSKVYRECVDIIAEARTIEELKEIKNEVIKKMDSIDRRKDFEPVKVGLVGEIYVVLEPAANLEIEETLGELGVYVERSMFFTHYTVSNAIMDLFHLAGERNVKKAARPFFNEMCGGHGRESVGNAVLYAKRGFDGVIQLSPFTCIPEIVAKSVLPAVAKKYDISVLSLSLDEQTGKAGLRTRLEAFVDLLFKKKQKKEGRFA